MSYEDRPLNLRELKQLIRLGINQISHDPSHQKAVLVIGDTGVGKSTLINFLSGNELIIKYDGLRPTLDSMESSQVKIGHEKFSETSVPTKVVINDMAFFDCPGFKDNKSEEQDIANSFYVQRLLGLYSKVKIVLVVDESHISEVRADKLPKLLRNLLAAFHTFEDIKDGLCMVINRAGRDNFEEEYHEAILSMCDLSSENGPLFLPEEQKLLRFLVEENRVLLFKQAPKKGMSKSFIAEASENRIMQCINEISFVRSRHITNIISENAKLAIRDFIDEITKKSNKKIELICGEIIQNFRNRSSQMGKNVHNVMQLKAEVIKFSDSIKRAEKEEIVLLLQQEIPRSKMQDFEEDFASVMFFRDIYDKTTTYFSNLVNKIYSELSYLLNLLDQRITTIQREEEEEQRREQEKLQELMRAERLKQERLEWEKKEEERIRREREEAMIQQQKRREEERLIKLREEEERIERETQARIRAEEERIRLEQERIEREREEYTKREMERIERERQEQIRREEDRLERERQQQIRRAQIEEERERRKQELIKVEQERQERERQERDRIERERQEKILKEQARQEQVRREWEERERSKREDEERQRERQEQLRREEDEWRKQYEQLQKQEEEKEWKLQEQLRREEEDREKQREYLQWRAEQEQLEREEELRMKFEKQEERQKIEEQRVRKYLMERQQMEQERTEEEMRQQSRIKWNEERMGLMEKIRRALSDLNNFESELNRVKAAAINLHNFNKKIEQDFNRMEETYFSKSKK